MLTKQQINEIEVKYPPATGAGFTWKADVRNEIVALCATVRELRAALELAMDWALDDWFVQQNDGINAERQHIEEMLK